MVVKRAVSAVKRKVVVSKADQRKVIIDRMYCHCRYCNFFFLRKFEGDDVCDARGCVALKESEVDE